METIGEEGCGVARKAAVAGFFMRVLQCIGSILPFCGQGDGSF
jgi:hypothetical protein